MDNQGNGGILSKFQQRLRNIRLSRSKKKSQNEQFIQEKVEEIRKTIRKDTSFVDRKVKYKGIGEKEKEIVPKKESISQVIVDIRETSNERNYAGKKVGISNEEQNKIIEKDNVNDKEVSSFHQDEKKEDTNISRIKPRKVGYVSNQKRKQIKRGSDIEARELLNQLGTEIIDKIKNSFEDKLDELSVVMSELYFLEKTQENELELKKVKELQNKINDLIKEVNEIVEQYNLYKDNYYIENITAIDDSVLADDIIQYRDLLDSLSLEKKFVKEYKALDEFNRLYHNLKVVRADAEKLAQSNEEKIEKFDIRDKKYNDIKLGMVLASDIDKKCTLEIERQNEYFANLMQKIHIINKEEYVTTHLRGVGELVSSSLNYVGLLMLSPLSGLIPSIALQTIATKKMIGNIYRNMHIEEVNHIRYEAINYDSELNHHLCSVDYTADLLDDTLKDIRKLKEDFLLQYDSRISGYRETLKNIQKIENKVLHNQNRVEIIRRNLKKSKKINEDKMVRVRKLNEN